MLSEPRTPPDGASESDLRPIRARLDEIRRKCRSMAARNDEARDITARLDAIIDRLDPGRTDGDEPIDYGQIARQLFPVARLFESLGFLSIAREVAYVENALRRLAPDAPPTDPAPTSIAGQPKPGLTPTHRPAGERKEPELLDSDAGDGGAGHRWAIPAPVAAVVLAFLVAVLASILIVHWNRHVQRRAAAAEPTAEPAAPTVPTEAPDSMPTATAAPDGWEFTSEPTPASRALVAEEISQARVALMEGDVERAISHVSAAARVDMANSLVIETSRAIIRNLIARGDAAADEGEWGSADQHLERAREIALRFGIPPDEIDDAARRHASMVRFQRLRPDQHDEIRRLAGLPALVYLDDGSTIDGRIHGVRAPVLELDKYTEVGPRSGRLYYVEEIALARIKEIRVFND